MAASAETTSVRSWIATLAGAGAIGLGVAAGMALAAGTRRVALLLAALALGCAAGAARAAKGDAGRRD